MSDPISAVLAFLLHVSRFEVQPKQVVSAAPALDWHALRVCESGNNYSTNTGNGYYGAYQFDVQTWEGVGGTGLPSDASKQEQDKRAQRLYDLRGSEPWPVCGDLL